MDGHVLSPSEFFQQQNQKLFRLKATHLALILEVGEKNVTKEDYVRMKEEYQLFQEDFEKNWRKIKERAHRNYSKAASSHHTHKQENGPTEISHTQH